MRTSSLITAVIFASLTLYASTAAACHERCVDASNDPTVVAAVRTPDQPATTPQKPPASAD